jgi:hypothetical protein
MKKEGDWTYSWEFQNPNNDLPVPIPSDFDQSQLTKICLTISTPFYITPKKVAPTITAAQPNTSNLDSFR